MERNKANVTNTNVKKTPAERDVPKLPDSAECSVGTGTESIQQAEIRQTTNEQKHKNKAKQEQEKKPKPSYRFDGLNHLPDRDNKSEGRKGFRCKNEGCSKQTNVFCIKCNVHLCFVPERNCFLNYHLLN